MKTLLSILLCILLYTNTFCQDEATSKGPEIDLSGFIDVFYAYDIHQPNQMRQSFLFNHNRHNEFNINLGVMQLQATHEKYRGVLALQVGTYANDNYAAETGVMKNIMEAYAGVSLNKQNTLWLDAGLFSSHLGFESAISTENWTLTRSLVAENSPYFLTGAKLTYQPNEKWTLLAVVTNGWQRIQRVEGNSLLSWGTQVAYQPSENVVLNWSTFIGTDDPDAARRMRYFSNLYGTFQVSEKLGLIVGFDAGWQQTEKDSDNYDTWFAPTIIAQYRFNPEWAAAVRAEYYQDEAGVIIPTDTPNGFQTTGFSLNIDYTPNPNVAIRLEGRSFQSEDAVFTDFSGDTPTTAEGNFFMVASLALKFDSKLMR